MKKVLYTLGPDLFKKSKSKNTVSLYILYFAADGIPPPVSPLPKLPARRRYHKVDPTPGDEPLPSGWLEEP